MPTPFPGMDPWLENPTLWPDVHNRLIAAIADAMTPVLAPKYYIALEQRLQLITPEKPAVSVVPDLAISTRSPSGAWRPEEPAGVGVIEVDVKRSAKSRVTYLEVHEAAGGNLVTVIELLSPANKRPGAGRFKYEWKRDRMIDDTNLVEIDLLRDGEPMPVEGSPEDGDYRILISRFARSKAHLYRFSVRDPIPAVPLPLLPRDAEPPMNLNSILHALYDRARFDLRIDYDKPPALPLSEADADWARGLLAR